MNVKDGIVVIIGGASGIGYSCAEQFLLRNVKFVAIFDLPTSNGRDVAERLKNQFGENRVAFFPCNIVDEEQVKSSFDEVAKSFGNFDILINSAGFLTNGEKWERMIHVNFTGLVRTTLKAIDIMGKHKGGKGGTIVNISSMAGLAPVTHYPIYAATKHAVVGFTNSLALSYNETGIRMMLMCPGRTVSPLAENLDNFDNPHLSFINVDNVSKYLETIGDQPPECVAKAMVQLVEKGENGAICFVHNSEPPYLVDIPTLDKLEKHTL